MAEEFRLGPEEAVVLRMKNVGYGEGFQLPPLFGGNELILTTQNLILLKKDLFGSTTDTVYFPLNEIKVVGGRPQVRKGNPAHMEYTLEVYFNYRHGEFPLRVGIRHRQLGQTHRLDHHRRARQRR